MHSRVKLSDNFYYSELIYSDTAKRLGINNETNSERILENARQLAVNCFEPIRKEFGRFSPNSWLRTEPLEKAICWGGPKSAFIKWCNKNLLIANDDSWKRYFSLKSHPLGQAGDIEIVGVDNDTLFKWCKENLKFDQLIREYPKRNDPHSGWVHISWSEKNRNMAFTIK